MNFDGNVPRCNFALYCFYCPSALKKLFTFLLLNSCSLEFWQFYFVLWLIFSVYLSNLVFCSVPRETLSVGSVQAQDGYWENRCRRVTKSLCITWVQSDTLVQEMPVSKGITTSRRQQLPSAVHGFCTETDPCDHTKPCPNSESSRTQAVWPCHRANDDVGALHSGAGNCRCIGGFSELVKGLAKARPVKFTAWSNVVASRIRIQN